MERTPVATRRKGLPSTFATLRSHLTDPEFWCLITIGALLTLHS